MDRTENYTIRNKGSWESDNAQLKFYTRILCNSSSERITSSIRNLTSLGMSCRLRFNLMQHHSLTKPFAFFIWNYTYRKSNPYFWLCLCKYTRQCKCHAYLSFADDFCTIFIEFIVLINKLSTACSRNCCEELVKKIKGWYGGQQLNYKFLHFYIRN